MQEKLDFLKRAVYRAFPTFRWGSSRNSYCFRRVRVPIDIFKVGGIWRNKVENTSVCGMFWRCSFYSSWAGIWRFPLCSLLYFILLLCLPFREHALTKSEHWLCRSVGRQSSATSRLPGHAFISCQCSMTRSTTGRGFPVSDILPRSTWRHSLLAALQENSSLQWELREWFFVTSKCLRFLN